MKAQMSAMAVQCNKCGELFDLSYDLEGFSEERLMAGIMKAATLSKRSGLLCWECRNKK